MRTTKTVDDFSATITHAATVAAPLFNMYGWVYFDGVPDIYELTEQIESLVKDVLRQFNNGEDRCYISSGRFTVTYRQFDTERELDIYLDLASESEYKDWVNG